MYAAGRGYKEVVEALIKAGANLDATNKVRGVGRGGEGRGERMGEEGCDR